MAGAKLHSFTCPQCGGTVLLRALGQSITAICGSCHALIDTNNQIYKLIKKSQERRQRKQHLQLGQRGLLKGTLWEVIGYLEREDQQYHFAWSEYLLYNPLKGFRWLAEADGHWNFITTRPQVISADFFTKTHFEGRTYLLFNKGQATTTYAIGEFYWRVKVGDVVDMSDFICPPLMLSCERNRNELIWSQGEYTSPETIRNAFQLTMSLPEPNGVAANQPREVNPSLHWSVPRQWLAFAALITLVQFFQACTAKQNIVLTFPLTLAPIDTGKTIATPPFQLSGGTDNLEVEIRSNAYNSWFEVDGDLVNDSNGASEDFNSGVEYYTGTDSDGRWSEGSQSASTIVSSIPEGQYHLNLTPTGEAFQRGGTAAQVLVTRSVPMWSNWILAMIALSLFPIWSWWRDRSFEIERWSQSDYSPYPEHNDSEE